MKRLLLALLLLPTSGSALAAGLSETCDSTADCDTGLTCEVVGGSACACPEPAEGAEFAPACECPEAVDIKACVPGPCESNTDCAEGFVCATFEEGCGDTTEPAMPCRSGDPDCRPVDPEPCTPSTVSVCAPRWVLPCEAATDCGPGFECAAVETCSCSGGGSTDVPPDRGGSEPSEGSGGSGSSGSGSDSNAEPAEGAPMPPEEDCTCTPSDTNACRPIDTPCSADTDCGEGWRCELSGGDTPCTMPEGGTPDCGAPVPATEGLCEPIGWGGGGAFDDRGSAEEVSTPTNPTNDSEAGGEAGAIASGGGCAGGTLPLALLPLLPFALRRRR